MSTEAMEGEMQGVDEGRGLLIVGLARLPAAIILDATALADALGATTRTLRRMIARGGVGPAAGSRLKISDFPLDNARRTW
jgi:hypothetical protein